MYRCKHSSEEPEEVRPAADMGWKGVYEDDRTEQGYDEEGDRRAKYKHGFFPCRHLRVLLFFYGGRISGEEDEEQ